MAYFNSICTDIKSVLIIVLCICFFPFFKIICQNKVSPTEMQAIYDEIKTPFKYGLVLVPEEKNKMVDSPSIIRVGSSWIMIYIVFDGTGYETWIAESDDLLNWTTKGRIMSFTNGTWDENQKAGYISLQCYNWGESYKAQKFNGKYWMSYLGGETPGYEAGKLGIGIAYTTDSINLVHEWERLDTPILSSDDSDVRWYDNKTIYKSSIIWDKTKKLGSPFVMFYNAKGNNNKNVEAERIALAISDDMINWKRFGEEPIIDHGSGISGDAFLTKIENIWVMFYFGAFWEPGAFERFACSYDLVNWTKWEGDNLISPSEEFDNKYAHKPFVIKHDEIVYHFYCAVDSNNNRGIALATSVDLGKSSLDFIK